MRHLITLVLFTVLFVASFHSEAQPGGGPGLCGTPGNPPCGPGAPVPITGIEILIGAGALLGARRMIANRKANT